MKDLYKLLISLATVYLTAFLGSIVTTSSIPTWYTTLNKPEFNPPNWIFGPVWTLLYTLMGISFYLVWKHGVKNKKFEKARNIFLIQLGLNFLWSFVFFYLHLPGVAFIEIIVLWTFIVLTINNFYRINKVSSYLLVPYLLWVTFASLLNLYIVILN